MIEFLMNYGRRFVTLYRRQGSRPSHGKGMQKKKKNLDVRDIQKQNYSFFVPRIMYGSIINLVSQCFLCINSFKNF